MIVLRNNTILLHFPRTGGSYLKHWIKKLKLDYPGLNMDIGKTNLHIGRERVISHYPAFAELPFTVFIRNPLDWYASMWAKKFSDEPFEALLEQWVSGERGNFSKIFEKMVCADSERPSDIHVMSETSHTDYLRQLCSDLNICMPDSKALQVKKNTVKRTGFHYTQKSIDSILAMDSEIFKQYPFMLEKANACTR